VLIFPIWGGNLPPAVAIAIMSIGLMDRDGLFVVGGLAFGFVAMAIVGAVIAFGATLIAFSGDIFTAVSGVLGI
ncbi:MAG: exopolysaccharide biosynthesis protein, partial [Rhodospirillales bacterium]